MSETSTARAPEAGAPRRPGDVVFSAIGHLRLLLRVDRGRSIESAVARAVRPGSRVLDAGCGSGILSLLALKAGASQAVAIDRDNIDLAKALARENGLSQRIEFIEADLSALDPARVGGEFDALLAFVYTNHPVVDEPRSRVVSGLRAHFGGPACVTVPNRVRYWATACEWPALDAFTELTELGQAVADMESRYALKFGTLLEAARSEVLFGHSRPRIDGDYVWMPGPGQGGYRYRRGAGARLLSDRAAVCEIRYDTGPAFDRLPERVPLDIRASGTVTGILWTQELWLDEFLIWSSETFSPVAVATEVQAGGRLTALLDDRWRETNSATVLWAP
jgi:SAM-dependent methyltransferase